MRIKFDNYSKLWSHSFYTSFLDEWSLKLPPNFESECLLDLDDPKLNSSNYCFSYVSLQLRWKSYIIT